MPKLVLKLLAVLLILVAVGSAYYTGYLQGQQQAVVMPNVPVAPTDSSDWQPLEPQRPDGGVGGGVACTMEAKMCPDGSYVGRVPPNCEFAPCPTADFK